MKWPWAPLVSGPVVAGCWRLFLIVAFGPSVAPVTSQPGSRLALTAALAEHGTVDIHGLSARHRPRATYNGHLRSDKAPGQPVLAVPVYLAADAVGRESAAHLRQVGNLTAWWVTFWTSFVPFVALVVLMYLRGVSILAAGPRARRRRSGSGVCTMMLPHAVNLYGATLAAFTAYAAWAILERGSPRQWPTSRSRARWPARALLPEYETAIVFAVLAVVAAPRGPGAGRMVRARRGRARARRRAGTKPAAFGRPWRTAHDVLRDTRDPAGDRRLRPPGLAGDRGDLLRVARPVVDER